MIRMNYKGTVMHIGAAPAEEQMRFRIKLLP